MIVEQSEQRTCAECGETFVYTEPEQRFRAEHGMSGPIRCPECRSRNRSQRNADLGMGKAGAAFRAREQGGDRRRTSRGGRANGGAERHPAVCAACGSNTMVPFIPRGDRPVYCRDCYNARRGR